MPENIKEKLEFGPENQLRDTSLRKEGIVEVDKEPTVPREIDSWLTKHEKANQGMTKLGEDGRVKAGDQDKVVINVPVTRKKFVDGLKMPVSEVGRWLSTFISKLIKMDKEVKFKEEEKEE
jgi:hypothetical protein